MREPPAPVTAGPGVWQESGRLADGREIIYFDESPGTGRAQVRDTRDFGAGEQAEPGPGSDLRWDPLLGEWVVIAAQRQGRTFLPPAEHCPLDPSRPGRPTEIPAPDYDVVVFENRFPSLYGASAASGIAVPGGPGIFNGGKEPGSLSAPGEFWPVSPGGPGEAASTDGAASTHGPASTDGLITTARPAFGRCEVVCFTSDHDLSFAELPPRRVRTVVEAWADRSAALAAMDGIAQVFCFENRGEEIGVTLHHPHGQIYAFPFVTPRTAQIQAQAQAYTRSGRGNLFDDVVAAEIADGSRLVARNGEWTAFVPAAARWPYEILLFPARRVPDLPSLDEAQRAAFGDLYTGVLGRLGAIFDGPPPYIAAWYQAPVVPGPASREFALHLRVMSVRRAPGKLKYLAGTESGMGVWINDVVPETAARRLRDAR